MGLLPQTETFLSRAARRRWWAEFGRRSGGMMWYLAVLFLILLLVARLSAAIPDVFSPSMLPMLPLIGAIVAWCTQRRVGKADVAAMIDRHEKNHDLFLTTVHLESSAGAYQEQVRSRAEAAASPGSTFPDMIPWRWQKPVLRLLGVGLVLMAFIRFLPQLDPFGKADERRWLGRQEERLEELRRETEVAAAAREPEEAKRRGEEIHQALKELEETFRLAKPEASKATARKLSERQKELGRFWKQLDDDKLREALDRASEKMQELGRLDGGLSPEAKAFRDQLREMLRRGDARELQKTLAEMLEKAEALQKPGLSPEQRRQGAKQVKESLQEMAAAVSREAPSQKLGETLQRAIEQMQMAQNEQLQELALEGGQKSMKQLEEELQDLAQQLQQLQQLEEGLDAAQLAQELNKLGAMPGPGNGPGEGSMEDYAELYRELLAQTQGGGPGPGSGMGGPGTGEGGVAPEDESQKTDFKPEKSPSHLVAGKTLLEWQTSGVSETGEAREAYQGSMAQLKQGVSEAIRQEKVPAGYHSQIRNYFDSLEEAPPGEDDLE